jgi:hypothetical protein
VLAASGFDAVGRRPLQCLADHLQLELRGEGLPLLARLSREHALIFSLKKSTVQIILPRVGL